MNTPGKILKAERAKKEMSLEGLSESLKIKAEYLRAIENDDYRPIPSETFVIGYVRLYADAVGLDGDRVLDLYKKQTGKDRQTGKEGKEQKKIIDTLFDKAREIKGLSDRLLKKNEDE